MDVDKIAEVVEEMILQHDYPGFEPRALKLGLPDAITKAPAKVFGQALGHPSVYVKLAALRWFQERPGQITQVNAVLGLLDNKDPFVRLEAVRLLERLNQPKQEMVLEISKLLQDEDQEVRRAAAKACGKMCSKLNIKDQTIINNLQVAASHGDSQLRGKAEKALRKIGVYD